MSKGKHSEAEMIGAMKQLEAGRTAADNGTCSATICHRNAAN